jgi:hypothetical protein
VARIPDHLEEWECQGYSDWLFKSLPESVSWLQPQDILPWSPDPNKVPYRGSPVVMMFFSPDAPQQQPPPVIAHFRQKLSMWKMYATDNTGMMCSYKTGPGQQSKLRVEFSNHYLLPIVKTSKADGGWDQV